MLRRAHDRARDPVAVGVLALVAEFYARRTRRADAGDIPADKVVGPVELVWHWSYEAICAALDRRKEKKEAKAAAKRAAGDTTSAAAATGSASPSAT